LPDVPVQVFAVTIDLNGVHWFEAEIVRITEINVIVRYGGAVARLHREKLWRHWSWWRGVMFVASRSGRIADELDRLWRDRYGRAEGGPPPAMRMPLADAIAQLGVPRDYTPAPMSSPPFAARPRLPIPTTAAPPKRSGNWSRRATGCSLRSAKKRRKLPSILPERFRYPLCPRPLHLASYRRIGTAAPAISVVIWRLGRAMPWRSRADAAIAAAYATPTTGRGGI
jgi:hypothetical protein